jgi:hypothetical protein
MYLPPGPDLAWKGQYISLPAATLKAPVEGNRTVPVEITWLRDGTSPSYAVVFNAREQRVTPLTQIAAVHISNIHSAVPVRLLFPDTGFEIELGSNLEGYYPVVTNGLEFVAYTPLAPSGFDSVTIQVLNFLPPPLVFGLSPGGTVAGVARIDTAAPLAGGPVTSSGTISLDVPLAIQFGGTGAITPDLAMDALAETGGSTVGLLSRNAAGNWVMQPLAAAGPPALPVSILNGGTGATTGFLALDNLSAAGSQTGVLQRVAGGNWSLVVAGTGTITGVTAGPGLSGGGGTGVVTLGLSIPVQFANGGTAATTRNGAMDSLTTASGADAGILTRSAAGNWGLDLGGLDVANGGTGAVTAPAALTNLGALPLAGGAISGNLDVQGRAALMNVDFGDTLATRKGFVDGSNGFASFDGDLNVGGTVTMAGSPILGVVSGWTDLWGPDNGGTGQIRGVFVGTTASGGISYRHTAHWWQDAAGASQFGQISDAGMVIGNPPGGSKGAGTINAVTVYGNNVVLNSDAALKRNVEPLPPCLPAVLAIEPKSYHWAVPELPERPSGEGRLTASELAPPGFYEAFNRGFLAQDVAAVLGGADDVVDLGGITAVLWKAVQELAAQVAALQLPVRPVPRGHKEPAS